MKEKILIEYQRGFSNSMIFIEALGMYVIVVVRFSKSFCDNDVELMAGKMVFLLLIPNSSGCDVPTPSNMKKNMFSI